MDVVGRVPGVLCMREAFSPAGVFGLNSRGGVVGHEIAAHLGFPNIQERHPNLIAFARNDPEGVIEIAETAAAAAGYHWLGVTLMPTQIDGTNLKRLASAPDTHIVFLMRRHLPRFISLEKANAVGAWKYVDTTDVKPEVEIERLEVAIRNVEDWFALATGIIRDLGLPSVTLTYETHVRGGPETTLAALSEAFPDFPWRPGDPVGNPITTRQDAEEDDFAKLGNGDALKAELTRRDLLETALSYPSSSSLK